MHDEVWIPISIILERRFNGAEAYCANLDWKSVNETPSDGRFLPESLDVNPASIIVDGRLGGRPVVVGKVKDNGRPPVRPQEDRPPESIRGRAYWIVAGNIAALVSVGIFLLWRRLRSR